MLEIQQIQDRHPCKKRSPIRRASRQTPVATRSDNARYIAQLCDEMSVMAMSANLNFLAYLLTMAQAEAQYAIDRDA